MNTTTTRRNILWIFVEDLSPWLSLYGDPTARTPNLEALAASGVTWRNCFSIAPVCSPVRSGLITGCMPTTNGIHQHVSARLEEPPIFLPPPVRTLPEIFRDHGYFTFNGGKDDYNFTYNRDDLYWGAHEQIEFYGEHDSAFKCEETETRDWRVWRNRPEGSPFFGQFTLWGGKNKQPAPRAIDPDTMRLAPYYPDLPEFREIYARHYENIEKTDREVGAILRALEEDGLLDSTAVFFFSDHGCDLLRHKQFCYDGGIHVPLITRIPGMDPAAAGTVRDDLVSSLDIGGATLELAGIAIPEWMETRDFLAPGFDRDFVVSTRDRCDFTIDRIRSVRDLRFKYIRNFFTDQPLMQPQYRDGHECYKKWKRLAEEGKLPPVQSLFMSAERPAEELYDTVNDPHETVNLADDPSHQETLAVMRERLESWIRETGDLGQFPESREEYLALRDRWGRDRCVNPEFQNLESE